MQLASYQCSTGAVWADALFVSALQRSGNPSAGQLRQATAATVRECAWALAGDRTPGAEPLLRRSSEIAGQLLVRGSQPQAEAG